MRLAAIRVAALALAAWLAPGCATYSDRTQAARQAVSAGDYQAGLDQIDAALGASGGDGLPAEWDGDGPLAVLERAVLLQALGRYAESARDFEAADLKLELLDLSGDINGSILQYVYSDSAGSYRTSPTEKLALNAFNLLNYLARGDLSGAAVEARRFTVMRNYLLEYDPDHAHGSFGSYLAGFVFERLGEPDRALRYYDEALQEHALESLRAPVTRLAARAPYRGERLAPYAGGDAGNGGPRAEILAVVSLGRVPHKVPERIPVGAALGVAGTYATGNPEVLGYSVLKVVSYPALTSAAGEFGRAELRVDGRAVPAELASDLGGAIRREYEALKPRILAAAISRLIVRAAAAEGARAGSDEAGAGEVLRWVAALFTEGALLALDVPDTRSWTLLPERVLIARASVAPGPHEVAIALEGPGEPVRSETVDLPPGGFAVLVWTEPR